MPKLPLWKELDTAKAATKREAAYWAQLRDKEGDATAKVEKLRVEAVARQSWARKYPSSSARDIANEAWDRVGRAIETRKRAIRDTDVAFVQSEKAERHETSVRRRVTEDELRRKLIGTPQRGKKLIR